MSKKMTPEGMMLIAKMLKTCMPEGHGFTLLVFEENNELGKVSYISSGQRKDMKETMRTMVNKWDSLDEFEQPNLN